MFIINTYVNSGLFYGKLFYYLFNNKDILQNLNLISQNSKENPIEQLLIKRYLYRIAHTIIAIRYLNRMVVEFRTTYASNAYHH